MKLDYIKKDAGGYDYNGIFPPAGAPDPACWQKPYSGYKNSGEEAFFHAYAVEGYNIEFNYHGAIYILLGWMDGDHIALLDANDKELQLFTDPMDALMRSEVDGHKLLDILADITDIECG